jgi:hypothetical protein
VVAALAGDSQEDFQVSAEKVSIEVVAVVVQEVQEVQEANTVTD